eukprot:COSAG05_NODE_1767_length_4117_cov_8.548780_3_plen_52_part_00
MSPRAWRRLNGLIVLLIVLFSTINLVCNELAYFVEYATALITAFSISLLRS